MRRALVWIGVAISVILVVVSLGGLKLDQVWGTLRTANLAWIAPGVAAYFIAVLFRTWRWQYLLRPHKRVALGPLYQIVMIGYMGNNIYPARIGELLRAYVLRREQDVPMAYSISNVLLERIVDGLVMVAFVLIGLSRVPNLSAAALNLVLFAATAFGIATGVFFWFALRPATAERFAHAVVERLLPHRLHPPLMRFVTRFVEGAQSLRSPADLAVIVVLTIVAWLVETVKYWCIERAFGLPLQFIDLMLLNGAANLSTIIPSGPGFVGTFDAAGIGVLTALGLDANTAAAYTLALHAVLWLPVTAAGAFFLLRKGMRWGDLQRAEQTTADV